MNPDYPLAVWTAFAALAAVAFLAVRDAKAKHGWPWTRSKSRHRAPVGRSTLRLVRGRYRWDLGVMPQVTR